MMEMPPLQFAQANGVRLAFYDAGPRDDPTPFLLCHGFPEIAFTWRRQIKGLSEAGFRAIALDQRGYGASDRPPEVEAYSIDRLAGDLVGLLDHLKIDKAIIVGHDWGGYVVWETALRYPDRVAGVVSLNSPHVKRAPADPIAMLRARFGDRMYIVRFQDGREPDRILAENVDRVFDALLPAGRRSRRRRGRRRPGFHRPRSDLRHGSRPPAADHVRGGAAGVRRGLQTERLHRWNQLVSQHHPQLGKRSRSRPDDKRAGAHDHGRAGSDAVPSIRHGRSRPQSDQASRARLRPLDAGRKARRGERHDRRLAEARSRTIGFANAMPSAPAPKRLVDRGHDAQPGDTPASSQLTTHRRYPSARNPFP